ncbi:MAG: DUF2088 domain-containing protein [Desulfobacter sp.]|nr:MAG: DUF2088 domain-containing protein [Desulfobacter sp.]
MAADRNFPHMYLVRQVFDNHPLKDVPGELKRQLAGMGLDSRIRPGQTVAVTAGSRGITDILPVIRTLVTVLKGAGAQPFVIPAMGSHGGATAGGQAAVLRELGITAEAVGAPVRSGMAVEKIGTTACGVPVYVDRMAMDADHIVLVNRVKPHTDFEAEIESGLTKMAAIGLGNRMGAETCHNAILDRGYAETFAAVAGVILDKAPVTLGVGIVENQQDLTEAVGTAWAEAIPDLDRDLLVRAKSVFPGLPFDRIDLLIVDEMGKDISGTGMDQNIIARTVIRCGTVPDRPEIKRIFVRDLTPASRGTATGIGNADFTTAKLIEKMDRKATYTNCISSCEPAMASLPPWFDTDREAVDAALGTIGLVPPEAARIVHIKNTLDIETLSVSAALAREARMNTGLAVGDTAAPLAFDSSGALISPW